MKLPKPDYRQIAYGKLLTPQQTQVNRSDVEADLNELEQLIVESDGVANALIQSCSDPSEMERLATAILHVMDGNGLAYDLLSRQVRALVPPGTWVSALTSGCSPACL